MQTIEFDTRIENEGEIPIPEGATKALRPGDIVHVTLNIINAGHDLTNNVQDDRELNGLRSSDLLRFVGLIPPDDLKRMSEVIEDECERVDLNEWQ